MSEPNNSFCTIIIPAVLVLAARELGEALSSGGAGMYTTGLSPDGTEPATSYISSGMIDSDFLPLLEDGELLWNVASTRAAEIGLTLTATREDAIALVGSSDVSEEEPFSAMARLGLQMVRPPEEVMQNYTPPEEPVTPPEEPQEV